MLPLSLSLGLLVAALSWSPSLETAGTDAVARHAFVPRAALPNLAWSELSLVDADNQSFQLKELRGKILLLDFIFTSCPATCPTQTAGLAKVWKTLPAKEKASIAFVSLTIDPSHDDAAALRAYRQRFDMGPSPWTFASGSVSHLESIAAYFGSLMPGRSPLEHKTRLFLMGPQGDLIMNYAASPLDGERLTKELVEAVHLFIR